MFSKISIARLFSALLVIILALAQVSPAQAIPGDTIRISVDSSGAQGNNDSYRLSISANGRYMAFASDASNLVSEDVNGVTDVFVRDTVTNTTTLVSVASDGTQGNDMSDFPFISADGRYVAFWSCADNLVSNDTNEIYDVFVRDTVTNTTTLVSVASDGTQGNDGSGGWGTSISTDGRYIAFESESSNLVSGDTNGAWDVFMRDTVMNTTTRISVASSGIQGNGDSDFPSISADGRYVAFTSRASNLVSGDTNRWEDVFVRDTVMNTTTRVSVASSGMQGNANSYGPSISADGRYVALNSHASNLVSGDTNGVADVFVRDTVTNTTTRVSVASNGAQGNDYSRYELSISANGRYVAFGSYASNLVSGDTNGMVDVFVRDTATNTTRRVSVASDGTQGNDGSIGPSASADGRYVAFYSSASNLVSGDTNGMIDVFVHENSILSVASLSVKSNGAQDGWILESSEISKKGGSLDAIATTFRLGDDAAKKQYLGILSFSTGAKLPDNAVVTKVTLKVKRQGVVGGGNPVTTFQGFLVDIKKGTFSIAALQVGDFQAPLGAAGKTCGPFKPALVGGWYSIDLTAGSAYVNVASGLTQIRLRFKLDDNNNAVANYLNLFSGNAVAASQPQLIIEYLVP